MSFLIRITNLPQSVDQSSFKDLLDSVIKTNLPSNFSHTVTEFIDSVIDTDNDTDSISSDDELKSVAAIVRLYDYYDCVSLFNILNGYEWLGKILSVEILEGEKDDYPPNSVYQGNQSPYMYLQYPFYRMYPYLPPQYSTPFANSSHINQQIPPPLPSSGSSIHTPVSSTYPFSEISQGRPYSSTSSSLNTIESFDSTKKKSDINLKTEIEIDNTNHQNLNQGRESEGDYIIVKNEDDNEFIKVNPCRLFIGNVPYSSNWVSLRNFFISKAKEIDATKKVEILRVEIPMQTGAPRSKSDSYALGSYQRLGDGTRLSGSSSGMIPTGATIPISKSRGFAIVTTADRESATNLIDMFDNINFEGRSLTVRFDKFPDYNNYTVQQLHAPTPVQRPGGFGVNSAIISNLAFERNLFQHKLYYGNMIYPYYNYMYYDNTNPGTTNPSTTNHKYYERRNSFRSNNNYSYKNYGRNYDTAIFTPTRELRNDANKERGVDPNLQILDETDQQADQEKPQTEIDEDDKVQDLVTSLSNVQLPSS